MNTYHNQKMKSLSKCLVERCTEEEHRSEAELKCCGDARRRHEDWGSRLMIDYTRFASSTDTTKHWGDRTGR